VWWVRVFCKSGWLTCPHFFSNVACFRASKVTTIRHCSRWNVLFFVPILYCLSVTFCTLGFRPFLICYKPPVSWGNKRMCTQTLTTCMKGKHQEFTWCFPFMQVLSVCTDVEFAVCGICVGLSTLWRQIRSADVSRRQQTSADVSRRQHTSADVRIRQHAYPHSRNPCLVKTGALSSIVDVFFQRKKNWTKPIYRSFPLLLLRAHVTSSSDVTY
jgi:hypothetical protein